MFFLASTLPLATNPCQLDESTCNQVYDWTGNAQLAQPRTS